LDLNFIRGTDLSELTEKSCEFSLLFYRILDRLLILFLLRSRHRPVRIERELPYFPTKLVKIQQRHSRQRPSENAATAFIDQFNNPNLPQWQWYTPSSKATETAAIQCFQPEAALVKSDL
jgi:hypothetical protein